MSTLFDLRVQAIAALEQGRTDPSMRRRDLAPRYDGPMEWHSARVGWVQRRYPEHVDTVLSPLIDGPLRSLRAGDSGRAVMRQIVQWALIRWWAWLPSGQDSAIHVPSAAAVARLAAAERALLAGERAAAVRRELVDIAADVRGGWA